VHKALAIGPVDHAVDRSRELALWICRPESSLSGSGLGRPGGRPTCILPWDGRPADRPTAPTVRNLTVGRSTGRSTDRPFWACLDPNDYIS